MEDTTLAQKYQQKTDKQHILDNPDTYIGSVEQIETTLWIYNKKAKEIDEGKVEGEKEFEGEKEEKKPEEKEIIQSTITYIPGLFKLFDEGIVNCRDHVIRMQQQKNDHPEMDTKLVTYIDITIGEDGMITMCNDGNGIDVAIHPETNVWIPEMIFGHLRTSTNYDKTEKKIVGGKNGFGFKLVLIWSTYGYIETVDHTRGLKYCQEFKQNLDEICKPVITSSKSKVPLKPYTKICFKPDYARLGIANLTADMVALFQKRVWDIAAVTDKNIKVYYGTTPTNKQLVPIKTFAQYVSLYIDDEAPRVHEIGGERWEYVVALTPSSEFMQISFVNGIHTLKGGKHVEYILGQIVKKVSDYIEKKKKVRVQPNSIKEQLILFIKCDIENPAFDSQTKDYMNTPIGKFGSKCEVSDKCIEKIIKMGVMNTACALSEIKETQMLKKMDGCKTKTMRGIPKLTDANLAGTAQSAKCMLICCEGDSAKAGVLSGLSPEDRDFIGVYPLKGKLMNVRGELDKTIWGSKAIGATGNKEIIEITKIMGLETGKHYTQEEVGKLLRYGKLIFVTDQDLDGSHIKGLGINLIHSIWPSLTHMDQFLGFMNTPILKAKKGAQELCFYNNGEYDAWKNTLAENQISSWTIKYYKGLGTSVAKEFREYMKEKKFVYFTHSPQCDDAIDMAFNKKRANDRKAWLKLHDRTTFLDTSKPAITYHEFVDNELRPFSAYDCERGIPSIMDGLKPSQRKILFAAFKRNLTSEIKVAQFMGYVSEHSCYHHGEASLYTTIVGMAQNFVGSNNIHLLEPNGQFGTRLMGGKDAASDRYIYTQLNALTRSIFLLKDDAVLDYVSDDGTSVEPLHYAPIVPFVLVNGSCGIGTGSSTEILSYNPLTIMDYLEAKLTNVNAVATTVSFVPYYQGFQGSIQKISAETDPDKWLVKGCYHKVGVDTIVVTELPIGFWTQDCKNLLEELLVNEKNKEKKEKGKANEKDKEKKEKTKEAPVVIKDFKENHTDTTVCFTITFAPGKLEEYENMTNAFNINGIEKLLKLTTTLSTSNMHLYDEKGVLTKYATVTDIIDHYCKVRLEIYAKRKTHVIQDLERKLMVLSNKTKYMDELLAEPPTIDLRKKKTEEINALLQAKQYDQLADNYNYLVKMPMDSVSEELLSKLRKQFDAMRDELQQTKDTSPTDFWLQELHMLRTKYNEYMFKRKEELDLELELEKNTVKQMNVKKTVKKVKQSK